MLTYFTISLSVAILFVLFGLFGGDEQRSQTLSYVTVVALFIAATVSLLRLAPISICMISGDTIVGLLISFQVLILGYASGFRGITILIALGLTAVLTPICSYVYASYEWLFLPQHVYWLFGFSYLLVVAKADQNTWFERLVLSMPRLNFVKAHLASLEPLVVELSFKSAMVTSTNILYCLPHESGISLHIAYVLLFVNLSIAYHLVGSVKLPYYVASSLEIFHCAVPMRLIQIVGVIFNLLIIGSYYFTFVYLLEYCHSFCGNTVPRTHVWTGFQAGIKKYLETRFSHEAVEKFTCEQHNAITDHFWNHRFKYGAATAAYANSDTYKQWYDRFQSEIDKILKR